MFLIFGTMEFRAAYCKTPLQIDIVNVPPEAKVNLKSFVSYVSKCIKLRGHLVDLEAQSRNASLRIVPY